MVRGGDPGPRYKESAIRHANLWRDFPEPARCGVTPASGLGLRYGPVPADRPEDGADAARPPSPDESLPPYEPPRFHPASLLACTLLLTVSSCAQLSIRRDTETSGTFTSTGRSITFLSWEMPRPAIQIAHENAADAGLPNIQATSVRATDWGWLDWLLEIVSMRSARVTGTWGYR